MILPLGMCNALECSYSKETDFFLDTAPGTGERAMNLKVLEWILASGRGAPTPVERIIRSSKTTGPVLLKKLLLITLIFSRETECMCLERISTTEKYIEQRRN